MPKQRQGTGQGVFVVMGVAGVFLFCCGGVGIGALYLYLRGANATNLFEVASRISETEKVIKAKPEPKEAPPPLGNLSDLIVGRWVLDERFVLEFLADGKCQEPNILGELKGRKVYITIKCDGTSCTVVLKVTDSDILNGPIRKPRCNGRCKGAICSACCPAE